jgi:SAM-dependent methyltransferase
MSEQTQRGGPDPTHPGLGRDVVQAYYSDLWERKRGPTPPRHEGRGPTRTDIAGRLLRPGKRLLDVGCWGGEGLERMAVAPRFRELYGIDLLESSIEAARAKGIRAERVDLNHQVLPFPDGFFDAVTCLAVIAQVFDPERVVAELKRVLRVGGQLVLSVGNIAALPHRAALLFGRLPVTSRDPGWDGGQLHYFTAGTTRRLLERHDLLVRGTFASGRWLALRQLFPTLLSRELLFDAVRVC